MDRRRFLTAGVALAAAPALLPLAGVSQQHAPVTGLPPAGADGWVSLLNGRDLSGWYTVLQKSGRGVAEAKRMVTMEDEMLHILGNEVNGESYESGYLATNAEFGDVRIRVEYRWGQKQFGQRAISKRDNGLLYGVVGADKVFPRCVECQIEEGDVGDFFLVDGIRGIQPAHNNGLFGINITREHGFPPPSGKPPTSEPVTGRMIKDGKVRVFFASNGVPVILSVGDVFDNWRIQAISTADVTLLDLQTAETHQIATGGSAEPHPGSVATIQVGQRFLASRPNPQQRPASTQTDE